MFQLLNCSHHNPQGLPFLSDSPLHQREGYGGNDERLLGTLNSQMGLNHNNFFQLFPFESFLNNSIHRGINLPPDCLEPNQKLLCCLRIITLISTSLKTHIFSPVDQTLTTELEVEEQRESKAMPILWNHLFFFRKMLCVQIKAALLYSFLRAGCS